MAQDGAQAVKDMNKYEIPNPKSEIQIPPVTYDPALIESVVRRRVDAALAKDATWITAYRSELDDIYDQPDSDRSAAFAALDRRYFNRIGVSAVVDECLNERAVALAGASSITLIAAQTRSEEGVDVTRDRQLVLRYPPAAFDHVERFRANLRRELIQAADCFNPSFGHTPELLDKLMPSEKERIRAALSVLWGLSAQTRLCGEERAGTGNVSADSQRCLERLMTDVIDTFGDRHPPLLTILTDLPDHPPTFRQMFDICNKVLGSQAVATGICDLCRFPSEDAVFLRALAPDICGALKSEFPHLRDTAQVCARCAERQDFVLHLSSKQGEKHD